MTDDSPSFKWSTCCFLLNSQQYCVTVNFSLDAFYIHHLVITFANEVMLYPPFLSVCPSVCLLANLRKMHWSDFYGNFPEYVPVFVDEKKLIKF